MNNRKTRIGFSLLLGSLIWLANACPSAVAGEALPEREIICSIGELLPPLEHDSDSTVAGDSIVVPLILTNNLADDSVAGFVLEFSISDTALMKFEVDSSWWLVDSMCLEWDGPTCLEWAYDSVYLATTPFDVDGALTENWTLIAARVLGEDHRIARVTGLTVLSAFPPGTDTLIRLFAHTNGSLPDSICTGGSNVQLSFDRSEAQFSNTHSELIGCGSYDWVVDTFYFYCADWIEDSCIAWYDTVYDSVYSCILDTNLILLEGNTDGLSCSFVCGDADGNGIVNISDAVYLIAYIFGGGPPPDPLLSGDVNCDEIANISDGVYLIAYIFGGGPAPCAECP
jgi:hypothetical protein